MAKVRQFEDLSIWRDIVAFTISIYRISNKGELKNDFSLKDQLRRAVISISNNIAEGFEYDNNKEFAKFLKYAKGSAGEVRNVIHILFALEYITEDEKAKLLEDVILISRKLAGFIKYLKNYNDNPNNVVKDIDAVYYIKD